jgi:hypothetical protein
LTVNENNIIFNYLHEIMNIITQNTPTCGDLRAGSGERKRAAFTRRNMENSNDFEVKEAQAGLIVRAT